MANVLRVLVLGALTKAGAKLSRDATEYQTIDLTTITEALERP